MKKRKTLIQNKRVVLMKLMIAPVIPTISAVFGLSNLKVRSNKRESKRLKENALPSNHLTGIA